MILLAQFEEKDIVPPRLWQQCRQALARVLDAYGFDVVMREDRSSELEAYQRFWARRAEERAQADDFPATVAEAEVK